MNLLFWIFVVLDSALLLVLLVMGFTQQGHSDGGREMALIFSVLLPAMVVGIAAVVFLKASTPAWRTIALVVVAGPGLLLGVVRVRSAVIDYQVRQIGLGRRYFHGAALKDAGEAVAKRDTAALRALAPKVDLNAVGDGGVTLMRMAAESGNVEGVPGFNGVTALSVVQLLLELHANPNPGLEPATKHTNPAILTALLQAGADANLKGENGPIVFEWLSVMPVANFKLLLDHGLDINTVNSYGSPLVVQLARRDRWELLIMLLERGVDRTRGESDGTTVKDIVADRLSSKTYDVGTGAADLARVKAMLAVPK